MSYIILVYPIYSIIQFCKWNSVESPQDMLLISFLVFFFFFIKLLQNKRFLEQYNWISVLKRVSVRLHRILSSFVCDIETYLARTMGLWKCRWHVIEKKTFKRYIFFLISRNVYEVDGPKATEILCLVAPPPVIMLCFTLVGRRTATGGMFLGHTGEEFRYRKVNVYSAASSTCFGAYLYIIIYIYIQCLSRRVSDCLLSNNNFNKPI